MMGPEIQEVIDTYNRLRENCVLLAKRENGKLMGEYAWLSAALTDNDIRLDWTTGGINCYGSVYTVQTMDHEWFDFTIPFSELEG